MSAWSLSFLSKTRLFEQPSCASFKYSHSARDYGDAGEVHSSVDAKDTDQGLKRVSGVRYGGIEFHWEDLHLNMYAVFRTGVNFHFPPSNFNEFEIDEKPVFL